MGDPLRTLAVLEEAVVHLSAAPRLFDLMGSTYLRWLGRREEVVTAYGKSIALNPSNFIPYVNLCEYYVDTGRIDEARRVVAEGLAHVPQDIRLLAKEAQVQLRERRYQEAIDTDRALCRRYPGSYFAMAQLAGTYASAGRPAEAESVRTAVVGRWPQSTRALNAAGWERSSAVTTQTAEDLFRRAVAIDPHAYWPRKNLAHSLSRQRRPQEAEAVLLEMTETWPKDPETARALGDFYATETEDYSLPRSGPTEQWPWPRTGPMPTRAVPMCSRVGATTNRPLRPTERPSP